MRNLFLILTLAGVAMATTVLDMPEASAAVHEARADADLALCPSMAKVLALDTMRAAPVECVALDMSDPQDVVRAPADAPTADESTGSKARRWLTLLSLLALGAALTKDRMTESRHSPGRSTYYKLDSQANAAAVYKGGMVQLVAGFLRPAGDTVGGKVVGIAEETVVQAVGAAAGTNSVRVRSGEAFKLANNAGAIVQADIGKKALVIDDQTVTDAATTNNIEAGMIEEIDADGGIWVFIDHLASK